MSIVLLWWLTELMMGLLRIDNPVKEAHDALAHAATDTIRDAVLKGGAELDNRW